ncbi:MAG: coproporphyrinogen III oxidase family protein [Acidobacteria bacterium]|nr:coproporphyrinogen III oxidase family protein [Acidobacteriota bacterium]
MSPLDPATSGQTSQETEIGSVFVSNYPPYSAWSKDHLRQLQSSLSRAPKLDRGLGLYVHIPFCRKRCKFCYFKVYTGKNSQEVRTYLDALLREVELYQEQPAFRDRPLKFVYFGGGTPSYLSASQLNDLIDGLRSMTDWRKLEEFSFECEPGTLTEAKVKTLKEVGVTRLSLGVENFDDEILSHNGRAHVSQEIYRVLPWIKAAEFELFNLDLIAGMAGETEEKWQRTIHETLAADPDSVTIYQMELPFNTIYSSSIREAGEHEQFANWQTKRRWHQWAIEQLGKAGYVRSSAYTMVKAHKARPFVYRDALWDGADMMGTGVASFSHVQGVHYQNISNWGEYLDHLDQGLLPLQRAFVTDEDDQFRRQFILKLKLGEVDMQPFVDRFGQNPAEQFSEELAQYEEQGLLVVKKDRIKLTMDGLLRVDSLLPAFYDEAYRGKRYT